MATDILSEPYPPFEYGSSVRWRRDAGMLLEGSVCGFREITDETVAQTTGFPLGTVLVLVEIQSGGSVEIPLEELELI